MPVPVNCSYRRQTVGSSQNHALGSVATTKTIGVARAGVPVLLVAIYKVSSSLPIARRRARFTEALAIWTLKSFIDNGVARETATSAT